MKQNEKKTPIERPALLSVPANCAIMAVSKHREIMQPDNPVTKEVK